MAHPDDEVRPYPLFRGATRIPLWFGMPVAPMFIAIALVGAGAMLSHRLWVWLAMVPIGFVMRQIVKYDDRAFRIRGLWIDTKLRNFRSRKVWKASSYSPVSYRPEHRQTLLDRLRSRAGR